MAGSTSNTLEIPGYRVQRELGEGGMARVYLAVQESLEREVALKVLSTELVSDPEFCQRFLKEGKTLAKVTHPHVVTIFDSGEHQGIYYMCMELIRSGTLEDRIAGGQLALPKVIEVLRQVAEALAWSHDKGLVHRDIKPGNVLFRDQRTAVLSDFGIAKSMSKDATRMTAAGLAIGTPAYMSPEQASGHELTARSDQYSLGVMLFEMLTGEVPFRAETSFSVALQHLQSPVPSLPGKHRHLQPIVEKMMAKEPAERFNSLEEMLVALEAASPETSAARGTEIIDSSAAPAPRRARPVMLAAAGMGVAAALLAGGAFLAERQGYFGGGATEQVGGPGSDTPVATAEPADAVAAPLDPAEREQVEKWLDIAETHFEVGRLTAPPGNNALEAYRKVLEIDATNAAAKQGLEEIAATYVELARETLQEGNRTDTEALVKEGLEAFPDNQGLKQLRQRLAEG